MKKIISLLIVFAMIMGMCVNVFAAPIFNANVSSEKYFLLPIDNHIIHYSYSATDGENAISYQAYDRRVSGDAKTNEMTVDSNGTISLFSEAQSGTTSTKYYRVVAKGSSDTNSKNIYTISPYSYSFDDASTEGLTDIQIVSGGPNGDYATGTNQGTFSIKLSYSKPSYVTVLEADVNIVDTDFYVYNYNGGQYFVNISNSDIADGWHNIKLILNWDSMKYYAMIDNVLVDEYDELTINSVMNSSGLKIASANGVDNLKFYGTSLDIPHTLTVSNPIVGSELTASALTWESQNLINSELEYEILISNDGVSYTRCSDSNKYNVMSDDENKYIKAAVRVKESESVYGDWIYSDPVLIEEAKVEQPEEPATPFEWINTKDEIYVPQLSGDVYKYTYTHNGGGTDVPGAETSVNNPGLTVSTNSDGNFELTVNSAASTAGESFTITPKAAADVPVTVTLKSVPVYDFTNGSTDGFKGNGIKIETDADGNNYIMYDKNYIQHQFPDITGTVAIDFDILDEDYSSVSLYFDNALTYEVCLEKLTGQHAFKDRSDPGKYKYIEPIDGRYKVRFFLDTDNHKYSIFINGVALSINNTIPQAQGARTLPKYIRMVAPIDNFTYANVTPIVPVIYNAELSNVAVGKANTPKYDYFFGNVDESCTTYEWYVDDILVSSDAQFVPDTNMLGKYAKAKIIPDFGGIAVTTAPQLITDVEIGDIALTIAGAEADISKANINTYLTKNSLSEVSVSLTVSAKLNEGESKEVLFALCQYDNDGIKNLASSEAVLESTAQNIVLTLDANEVDDLHPLKLLVFDKETLTPLNNVIFLR